MGVSVGDGPAGAALLATVPLVLVHALSSRLGRLDGAPRHRLLSAAGGVPVAYVFLSLLPGLGRGQAALEQLGPASPLAALSDHVYLVALTSFLAFYGLERLANGHPSASPAVGPPARGPAGRASHAAPNARPDAAPNGSSGVAPGAVVFWLHLGSFALTNALTGFLLVQRARLGARPLAVFAGAMTLWFLVNDRGLHAHYGARYAGVGRWVLALALLGGWAAGAFAARPPGLVPILLQAVIAGSVLLNVLSAEVPRDRYSKFWPFALGAAAYGVLLLAL